MKHYLVVVITEKKEGDLPLSVSTHLNWIFAASKEEALGQGILMTKVDGQITKYEVLEVPSAIAPANFESDCVATSDFVGFKAEALVKNTALKKDLCNLCEKYELSNIVKSINDYK